MAPKPKAEVARARLSTAQDEAAGGDLRDAVQWSFASLGAAIDALAETHGIRIDERHCRPGQAASRLNEMGVLAKDISELHWLLDEECKAMFYEGEDSVLDDLSMEAVLLEIDAVVQIAEVEAQ